MHSSLPPPLRADAPPPYAAPRLTPTRYVRGCGNSRSSTAEPPFASAHWSRLQRRPPAVAARPRPASTPQTRQIGVAPMAPTGPMALPQPQRLRQRLHRTQATTAGRCFTTRAAWQSTCGTSTATRRRYTSRSASRARWTATPWTSRCSGAATRSGTWLGGAGRGRSGCGRLTACGWGVGTAKSQPGSCTRRCRGQCRASFHQEAGAAWGHLPCCNEAARSQLPWPCPAPTGPHSPSPLQRHDHRLRQQHQDDRRRHPHRRHQGSPDTHRCDSCSMPPTLGSVGLRAAWGVLCHHARERFAPTAATPHHPTVQRSY
jgi:hypothetical protein